MIYTCLVSLGLFVGFIIGWITTLSLCTTKPRDSLIWAVILGAAYIIGRVVGS